MKTARFLLLVLLAVLLPLRGALAEVAHCAAAAGWMAAAPVSAYVGEPAETAPRESTEEPAAPQSGPHGAGHHDDPASGAKRVAEPDAGAVAGHDAGPHAGPHAERDPAHEAAHGAEGKHATPDMAQPAVSEVAAPEASSAGHHDHSSLLADKCHLCTASCSSTPFISSLPSVAEPISIAVASYPAFTAPAPSHTSEGQERPPRST